MIEREIRISMRESDLQQRKKISQEKKNRAEDYHQLWEWFSTIKDRWAWIANSSLSQITDSSNPTRLRKPKGCLGTRVISPEVWRHVAESTANVLDTTEGLRGPLPAVPCGSPEEIERMCITETKSTYSSEIGRRAMPCISRSCLTFEICIRRIT